MFKRVIALIYLYIDPGTGSMLFTILLSVFGAGFYFIRTLFMKLKLRLSGGRRKGDSELLPLVIYSDDGRYFGVFKPICDELERRKAECVYLTQSEDDPVFSAGYSFIKGEFIGEGSKAFGRLNSLKALIVFSTTPSLDVFGWKRSPFVKWYVHIPHMANDITTYRMFGLDHYDAIMVSGAHQERDIRALEKLRGLNEKEIVPVGIPYMDVMMNRLKDSQKAITESKKRRILLAPSWGESGILKKYGSRMIDSLLQTGYELVIRPHPQSFRSEREMIEELMRKYPESESLSWNSDRDNFDVLLSSDILISDFSGVIFDFTLVFDKPVIYADTSFDTSPYDAWWLDKELWTFEILPSLGVQLTEEDLENIKDIIDGLIDDPKYKAGRDRARRETWINMGESAAYAADYLMEKYGELTGALTDEKKD